MEKEPLAAPRVGFGPFEYDQMSGDLTKFGLPVRLSGKPLQVLKLLVNQPGQIVTREQLQHHLWNGTTFVDFEQGLNSAVNKLRQTLGDSAAQPHYIDTIPSRGYRFVAPVLAKALSPQASATGSPQPINLKPNPISHWLSFALGGLALAMFAGAVYWSGLQSPSRVHPPGATHLSVVPPAGFALEGAASRQALALSPDGSRLAFTAMDTSGVFSLFVRDFTSLAPRQISNTEGAHSLLWRPDGRSLYFTAKGKLWNAQLDGGPHVFLLDSPPFMFSGTWLSPQRLLLDSYQASYMTGSSLGAPERLSGIYWWPQILPGSERLLCLMRDEKTGVRWARVVRSSDLKVVKNLFESDTRVQYAASQVTPEKGYLLYVRAGTLVARAFNPSSLEATGEAFPVAEKVYRFAPTGAADFSVSDRGTIAYQTSISRTHLSWVDRTGRELSTIGPANTNVKCGRLSPDGKSLAAAIYDLERGYHDLWIFNVRTNAARRLSSHTAMRDSPVWSPDSRNIAFAYSADGLLPSIHVRGMEAADPELSLPTGDFQIPTDWSADGRFVAFMNTGFPRLENEQQSDVSSFDRLHGNKIVPLLNTLFHEVGGSFSPDGKWLAFTSNESGRAEVYLQAFRSGDAPGLVGPRYLVCESGAATVRWRRDGRELYFLDFQGRIKAVSVRLSPKPEFGPANALFTISTEARAAIHTISGFDVSADGNRFVIPMVSGEDGPSIVVIQNWEDELPKRSVL